MILSFIFPYNSKEKKEIKQRWKEERKEEAE